MQTTKAIQKGYLQLRDILTGRVDISAKSAMENVFTKRASIKTHFESPSRPSSEEERLIGLNRGLARANEVLDRLEKHVSIEGQVILDIGSGNGETIIASHRRGAICYAVEPVCDFVYSCRDRFKEKESDIHLLVAAGENLPFKDETFDIVFCHQVLEHVPNISEIVKEAVRVLKPRGVFYLTSPNYLFPWEPHYKIPWFPYFPKSLATIYLRILGKPSKFLHDHVYYLNTVSVLRTIQRHRLELPTDYIEDIISNVYVSQKKRRNVIRILMSLKFLRVPTLIISLFSPTITLVSRKKS